MRTIIALASCAVVLLAGCSRQQGPPPQTVAQIDKQIQNVQNDPNIPTQVKGMILGKLEGQKQQIQQQQASGR